MSAIFPFFRRTGTKITQISATRIIGSMTSAAVKEAVKPNFLTQSATTARRLLATQAEFTTISDMPKIAAGASDNNSAGKKIAADKEAKPKNEKQNGSDKKSCKDDKASKAKKIAKIIVAAATGAASISFATFIQHQKNQKITGVGEIYDFYREQFKRHWIREMIPMFKTEDKELLDLVNAEFPEIEHLIPKNLEAFKKQLALKTPVTLKPLSESPVAFNADDSSVMAVGGPPALIGVALLNMLAEEEGIDLKIDYMNDERRWPIWHNSAFHIEEDADGEMYTSNTPYRHNKKVYSRTVLPGDRVNYEDVQKTGEYFWSGNDTFGLVKNLRQLPGAVELATNFQIKQMESPVERQKEADKVALECRGNEALLTKLDDVVFKKIGKRFLLPGKHGFIGAQNDAQVKALDAQAKGLAAEAGGGRILRPLPEAERQEYSVNGIAYADKTHDRVISPEFKKILTEYIRACGGEVINASEKTIYGKPNQNKNNKEAGHERSEMVVHYQTPDGQELHKSVHFMLHSIGSQPVINFNGKPVNTNVSAKGSASIWAILDPKEAGLVSTKLPRVNVPKAGEADHIPTISKEPKSVTFRGKEYYMQIIRATTGATIGALDQGGETSDHNLVHSLGQTTVVNKVYGRPGRLILPITQMGCNRVCSEKMQGDWNVPVQGMNNHNGMGGGGLTRAPQFVTYLMQTQQLKKTLASIGTKANAEHPAASAAAVVPSAINTRDFARK